MRVLVRALMLSLMLATLSTSALASAIYQYTGKIYGAAAQITDNDPPAGAYDPSMRIQITLELAEPLAPNLPFYDMTGASLSFTASDERDLGCQLGSRLDAVRVHDGLWWQDRRVDHRRHEVHPGPAWRLADRRHQRAILYDRSAGNRERLRARLRDHRLHVYLDG